MADWQSPSFFKIRMRSKLQELGNFSRSIRSTATCYRPDREAQIAPLMTHLHDAGQAMLARGYGLSYGDCCLSRGNSVIETTRLDHLLDFDERSGVLTCQAGTRFSDLFLVHPDYIPPVIPGTVHASLGGGIANDIHGKNNVQAGSLGRHIVWLDLQIGDRKLRCSPDEHPQLFQATLGGLGLTGLITRLAITMQRASRFLHVEGERHEHWDTLLPRMQGEGLKHAYQVAWLDLGRPGRGLLSFADHCDEPVTSRHRDWSIPPLPCRVLSAAGIRLFNHGYFHMANIAPRLESLSEFNNPLDSIRNWTRLYGRKGLLQCQVVFDEHNALETLQILHELMQRHRATPMLAVLKYFRQPGAGLLSFVQPGFTLAVDFMNNHASQMAIKAINARTGILGGKVYLAKDRFLSAEQFARQYPQQEAFRQILHEYQCGMQSDLSQRLGLSS